MSREERTTISVGIWWGEPIYLTGLDEADVQLVKQLITHLRNKNR